MMMGLPIAVYRAAERSMEPTISEGDYIAVWKPYRRLREGDIVVVRHPTKGVPLVKRVRSIRNGMISIEGDNKAESEDSRQFGAVAPSSILGKVIFKV